MDKKKSAKDKLNLKQREFAELYATDREFFGNGVQTYIEVYEPDMTKPKAYQEARSAASRMLTKANLLAYINELLDLVLNDAHVDKQLSFLITQHAELGVKLGAIREYNALKSRIKNKLEVTGKDGKAIPVSIVDFDKIDDTK